MDYSKKTWKTGDTITSEALNNIENALAALAAAQAPLTCEATATTDGTTGKQVITLDKTAAEVFAAAIEGKCVRFSLPFGGMTIDGVIPMEVFHGVSKDGEIYIIKARADTNPSDRLFLSGNLAGTDPVVLTEV